MRGKPTGKQFLSEHAAEIARIADDLERRSTRATLPTTKAQLRKSADVIRLEARRIESEHRLAHGYQRKRMPDAVIYPLASRPTA